VTVGAFEPTDHPCAPHIQPALRTPAYHIAPDPQLCQESLLSGGPVLDQPIPGYGGVVLSRRQPRQDTVLGLARSHQPRVAATRPASGASRRGGRTDRPPPRPTHQSATLRPARHFADDRVRRLPDRAVAPQNDPSRTEPPPRNRMPMCALSRSRYRGVLPAVLPRMLLSARCGRGVPDDESRWDDHRGCLVAAPFGMLERKSSADVARLGASCAMVVSATLDRFAMWLSSYATRPGNASATPLRHQ
jgi:hypothetical protein